MPKLNNRDILLIIMVFALCVFADLFVAGSKEAKLEIVGDSFEKVIDQYGQQQ